MQLCTDVKRFCTSIRGLKMFKRGKETKRSKLEISEPFNFKREITTLPGLSEDEISVLREQAAASCVGRAEAKAESTSPRHGHGHNLQQHRQLPRGQSPRARSASSSPQRNHYNTGPSSGYVSRPTTSHSAHSLLDYHSATSHPRHPLSASSGPVSRSYTPVSIAGSTRSNRSRQGQAPERCGSPMSTMSNRSLNRLVLPSLTTSGNTSATGSGANSDTESPFVIGSSLNINAGLGLANDNKKGGLDLHKLEIAMPMPVSPVSSLGSDDLHDDKFFIGSPVSPLSPRGSPKSVRVRS